MSTICRRSGRATDDLMSIAVKRSITRVDLDADFKRATSGDPATQQQEQKAKSTVPRPQAPTKPGDGRY